MARRNDVLDSYASAWFRAFDFDCESDLVPQIAKLQPLGVREAGFHFGRTAEGVFFTSLTSAIPEKGQAVDAGWVMQVRQLCEEAGPSLLAKMVSVAGPDGDDPDTDFRHLVAEGELLLFVRLWKCEKTPRMSVEVALPEIHLKRVEPVV